MRLRNSAERYGLVSKVIHWTTAILIIALVWLGWYMVGLTYFDKWYNGSLELHKSLGMLALGMAVCYLLWKVVSPAPASIHHGWQRRLAHAMHIVLAALTIVIPVSGYLISTSAGKPVAIFDLFEIPPVIDGGTALRDGAIAVHYYAAYGIAVLVCAHAGAAVKHQLFDKDGTLARMLWR